MEPESFQDKPKVREFELRQPRKSRGKQLIGLVVIALIVLGIGFFIFNQSKKKDTPKSTNPKAKTSASESAKKSSGECSVGQAYSSTKQGYQVCFNDTWKFKETQISALAVGFSDKDINESFPGTIVVSISDQSTELALQGRTDKSSKFEFGTTTVAGLKSTQVTFTRLKNDSLSTYPKGIETYFSKFGRTYTVALNSTEEAFTENQTFYTDFLTSWKFLENIKDPPWSASRNILVNFPWTGDKITSPLEIEGQAIAFEAVVNVRIKDSDNHVLADTTVQAASGTERSSFKEKIDFDKPTSKTGKVEVFVSSAKDGSEQDKVTIPVTFQ